MKCFVCGADMEPFLEKNFEMEIMNKCEFVRCKGCGLVISKTHYDMDDKTWQKLNYECHSWYQGTDSNYTDPHWIERLENQSRMLTSLFKKNVFSVDCNCLDYGCGDGKLVDMINKTMAKPVFKRYDEYMGVGKADYLSKSELVGSKFDFMVTCSVFEHLIGRHDVDKIFDILSENGTFGLHTLVCEEVPHDPDWFYFLPVHCTFYTNKTMERIFSQYGFKGCAYHVESRMWLFFRDEEVYRKVEGCVNEIEGTWQIGDGFVDYWKKKPYRSE